jgi:2-polyprenyl-3-methyl-5-hydroxy-6-metoxy-1,4-benzoquinol methylase
VNREQVRQAYASVAELYVELFGTSQQVHADDLAFIGRHLAGRPGTVLDLGCGPGHITDYLRSLGVDATGIDMVPEFIAHAQEAHPSGSYQLGSMENLAVANRSIAGILAWGSLRRGSRSGRPARAAGDGSADAVELTLRQDDPGIFS